MLHRAGFARWTTAACLLLGALTGCAGHRSRMESSRAQPTAEDIARRQELGEAAQTAMDKGDYDNARNLLNRLIAETPRSPLPYQKLGEVLLRQDRLDEAEAALRRALKLDDEYVGALIGLGEVESRRGRSLPALEHFEAAVELDPGRSEAHFGMGRTFEALGRPDEALAAYFRALESEPNSAATILRIARLQLARGQSDQALARLDRAVELTPNDPEALYVRGLAHLDLGHAEPAVADLTVAAGKLTDRPEVLYRLAIALEAARRPGEALKAVEGALALSPSFGDAESLAKRLRR